MPCSKYKSSAQRRLCFATNEWRDWSGIKDIKKMAKKRKRKAKRKRR